MIQKIKVDEKQSEVPDLGADFIFVAILSHFAKISAARRKATHWYLSLVGEDTWSREEG